MAPLPCNKHVAEQADPQRVIGRAIGRSHDRKPEVGSLCEPTTERREWPGGIDGETHVPKRDILNTTEAINRLGLTATFDEFRQKEYWTGHKQKSFNGEVSDEAVTVT